MAHCFSFGCSKSCYIPDNGLTYILFNEGCGALFGIAQLAFPPVAPFVALPFLLLAAYVGFRQMRTVSPGQVDDRLAALRDMHWDQFSVLIADAYRKQGYTVEAADKSAYDFTLTQGSRVTLLQCRRWKVNQLGVGPLEELARAVSAAPLADPPRLAVAGEPADEITELARSFDQIGRAHV